MGVVVVVDFASFGIEDEGGIIIIGPLPTQQSENGTFNFARSTTEFYYYLFKFISLKSGKVTWQIVILAQLLRGKQDNRRVK